MWLALYFFVLVLNWFYSFFFFLLKLAFWWLIWCCALRFLAFSSLFWLWHLSEFTAIDIIVFDHAQLYFLFLFTTLSHLHHITFLNFTQFRVTALRLAYLLYLINIIFRGGVGLVDICSLIYVDNLIYNWVAFPNFPFFGLLLYLTPMVLFLWDLIFLVRYQELLMRGQFVLLMYLLIYKHIYRRCNEWPVQNRVGRDLSLIRMAVLVDGLVWIQRNQVILYFDATYAFDLH